tara:strand:+ start:4282 stop:4860 length:579 start_codon:yes stop_codon:yes gene_type:complete
LKWLIVLSKHHKDWIEVAKKLGAGAYAEDIVQEVYLKLLKYSKPEKFIRNKTHVHRGYMFFVIRSVVMDYQRAKKGKFKIDIEKFYLNNEDGFKELDPRDLERLSTHNNIANEEAYQKICNKMDKELNNWGWYDKKIFEIYRDTHMSIRQMAKETTISKENIFHTLKRAKKIMKDKFEEDYEDYKNKDYDLL